MNYSKEQQSILNDETNFKQVIAAAGSGKTSTMIALLEQIIQKKEENNQHIEEYHIIRYVLHVQ